MTATYDNTLATARDRVRFEVGDTDILKPVFQDEEINRVLVDQPNENLAAARLLSNARSRWAAAGRGLLEKQVGTLRLQWGGSGNTSADDAILARIKELRLRGAPRPKLFKALR